MNKKLMILIGIIVIGITMFFVSQGHNPEFFDIFGLFVFAFLFIIGIWMLKSRQKLPDWIGFIILLIAILGLIVDGSIVIKTYILGG